jgi:hypothetical protein
LRRCFIGDLVHLGHNGLHYGRGRGLSGDLLDGGDGRLNLSLLGDRFPPGR